MCVPLKKKKKKKNLV